jgi:hypothetical protein
MRLSSAERRRKKRAAFCCARRKRSGSVLLDWLQLHRRMITAVFCLLIAALIALMIALVLLSDSKTFINAWYV